MTGLRKGAPPPTDHNVGKFQRVPQLQKPNLITGSRRPQGSNAQLLARYRAARQQCEVNRQLTDWILDLTARLKSAKSNFVYVDCSTEHHDLEAEVERLRLAIDLAKRCRS